MVRCKIKRLFDAKQNCLKCVSEFEALNDFLLYYSIRTLDPVIDAEQIEALTRMSNFTTFYSIRDGLFSKP